MTYKLLHFPTQHSQLDDPGQIAPRIVQPRPEQLAEAIQKAAYPMDSAFDYFLSEPMRAVSAQHWTPLVVAARAARWFEECNVRTVLDIGSGTGKFCVVAALAGHCHFTGLEHRGHLVASARALARTFKVENRVHFFEGALGTVSVPRADAYYLYNPFEENRSGNTERIDESVELSEERYARDLAAVRELFISAPAGTYVLTYNGFGAELPASYCEVRTDRNLPNTLRLWRKNELGAIHRSGSREPRRDDGRDGVAMGAFRSARGGERALPDLTKQ